MGDLMSFNSDDSEKGEKIENKFIIELFTLLDDIDTASDMFKPEQNAFYWYVMKKAGERFKNVTSDGFDLYWKVVSNG